MGPVAAVAILAPLLGAAAVMAAAPITGWRVRDTFSVAMGVATLALCAWLTTADGYAVSWIAGWEPVDGRAIGIAVTVDPIGAGVAALAAALASAALLFSWRHFEAIGPLYHTLMLLFLGGMVGFALTGDLFNLFVFFELLTIAAYALTAYNVEREAPLHGALNFAVTNTVGAFLMLHGIGVLYARTGTLAFAEVGRRLGDTTPDLPLLVAFALLSAGLFTKAAIVPFQFWLPDAHAVAPTPVSVLLSGVMIQLGLYGWARIYWTVFAPALDGNVDGLRLVIVTLGVVTALTGAVLASAQHHLKRLLAYSSVSHSGLILIGVGLLDRSGLAGAGVYTLAHGAIKGALFLLVGIVLHRHGSVDELSLTGRGRRQRWTGVLFALGALALAGTPPFGATLGKQLIEEAAKIHGLGGLVTSTFVIAGALTGGAVLRAAGRIFLGWGAGEPATDDDQVPDEERETEAASARTPLVMIVPVVSLLIGALVVGLVPQVAGIADRAAGLFTEPASYAAAVMDGVDVRMPPVEGPVGQSVEGMFAGGLAGLLALGIAALALGRREIPDPLRTPVRWALAAVEGVRELQSGHVGDYVALMTVGLALLAGAYVLVLS